jgi:hypothetical protein
MAGRVEIPHGPQHIRGARGWDAPVWYQCGHFYNGSADNLNVVADLEGYYAS